MHHLSTALSQLSIFLTHIKAASEREARTSWAELGFSLFSTRKTEGEEQGQFILQMALCLINVDSGSDPNLPK